MVEENGVGGMGAWPHSNAQQGDLPYDEAKVPNFTLPEVLALRSAERVRDAKSWNNRRRPEILAIYQTEAFGKGPAKPAKLRYEVNGLEKGSLGAKGDRQNVTV